MFAIERTQAQVPAAVQPSAGQSGADSGARSSTLSGIIADPTGAVIPSAQVQLLNDQGEKFSTVTDGIGHYSLSALSPGTYTITVTAPGFADAKREKFVLAPNRKATLDLSLIVETQSQEVQVHAAEEVEDAHSDAGAIRMKGSAISMLSNDPNQMLIQLQAMSGSDGDTPGSLYINGFSGGKLPPRSSIREIRLNNDPYSAQYDDFGSGRIEIFTKPGTGTLHGMFLESGNDAVFDARNPYSTIKPPIYASYERGSLSGPINKKMSYFLSGVVDQGQNFLFVDAETLNSANQQVSLTDTVSNPTLTFDINPRLDAQLSANNTLTVNYDFTRTTATNAGIGQLLLASQGYTSSTGVGTLQAGDTLALGTKFVNELRFQFIRTRTQQTPMSSSPTLIVEGAFTGGGNNLGNLSDHQDQYEFQNYSSVDLGKHFLRFGVRERLDRDANSSSADFNGEYIFSTLDAYQATLQGLQSGLTPAQIRASGGGASQFNIATGEPAVKILVSDTGFYVDDTWKVRPNLSIAYGGRLETQNYIADHADVAPRLSFSYGIRGTEKKPAVTTLNGGFGIFYTRFPAADILTAARENGILQQQYVLNSPDTYPGIPALSALTAQTTATTFQISPDYRSPYVMRTSIGVDRKFGEHFDVSGGYYNLRGVHQLLTRNINAPLPGTYKINDPSSGVRPFGGTQNIYQYDTMGVSRRNRIYVNGHYSNGDKLQVYGYYSASESRSDTSGGFPSNQYDIAADYGRTTYTSQRLFLGFFFNVLHGINGGPFLSTRSGYPFNVVVGQDLNGDGQFNDRPAFATDLSRPSVVRTRFGNFDTQPIAGQTIIPINYGMGPGLIALNLNLDKSFHFGPAVKPDPDAPKPQPGAKPQPPERRYTLSAGAEFDNILNHVNGGTPVGTLGSPLFGVSNSLATDSDNPNSSANRSINLQLYLEF